MGVTFARAHMILMSCLSSCLGVLGVVKIIQSLIAKFYWLIVAGVPLMPSYVLHEYHSALACSANGICFRYGYSILNMEGLSIVIFSAVLLWPMSIWKLVEGFFHAWFRPSLRQNRVGRIFSFLGRAYWLLVVAIPFLFWYLFGTFQAPFECVGNGDCINFYLPLDAVSKVAVLISCCLLWPMCLWKFVGTTVRRNE